MDKTKIPGRTKEAQGQKRKKDLRITIGTNAQGDQVLIEFSKSVILAAFDPETAIKIARSLLQAADDLKQMVKL